MYFDDAGLHPVMRENIKLCGYHFPIPIQAYSIPAILTGNDLIAVSQTEGSGKTAAFLIPILSKLMGKAKELAAPSPNLGNGFNEALDSVRAEPLVLIVAPTRELSTQIFDEACRLCYRSMLRPCVLYGGAPVRKQCIEFQKGCDVLIGTPGRLLDLMEKPPILSLHCVKYTIIDEADEMLHSDWETELTKLMSGGDTNEDADHRYMMFSATFNKQYRELARKFLAADHVRIRIGRAGGSHLNVSQKIVYVDDHLKKKALYDLLLPMPPSRSLIFSEREDALRAFRTAKCPIMVATGVSARGFDIRNAMHVINFDLPSTTHGGSEEYIHRLGRMARIGNEGVATSFYSHERNSGIAADLVKILLECKQTIPDFLESEKSEGEITFNDDTDDEYDSQNNNSGDASAAANNGWGAAAAANVAEEKPSKQGDPETSGAT
ncbi:ATP-dependent RNA helicase DBP2 [Paracoccidioides lutzii Pb01]|uniref:RNA helicase n=1 Tax=Paracoccidioides lutzii (strain ATCC MYA-826 / Pb01) TaxID=502779 RepID=C1GZB1_PARBA|nr:ATP-dependent RNA helicase DBP2 [Paracoccidioides lutzii Pb01]EEH41934.2 ATP-dependent RNA helicase DBP2 [Paracoccidioides lutzii Pb01]